MPALRATRQSNRTSRTSSPYVHSPNEPSTQTTTKESNRVDPDVWDEPPLKDPAPSFEEHGFDRVGVLETMAPLGSLPSLKLKGKTKDSIRRSTLSRSALGNQSEDALDSAKTTPSIPPSRSQSHMPEGQPSRDVSEPRDEEEDEEYVPNGHGPVTRHSKPPTKLNISFAALNQNPPPVTPSRRRSKGRDRLLKESVTEAIKVAEQNGQILIAITLQTLLDNRTREVAVDDLIHDILHQRKMTASQVELMRRFFALSTKRMNSTRSRDRGYIKAITSIGAAENRQHTQFSPHPSHLPFHNNLPTNTPDSQPSHSIKSSPVHPSLDASSQPGSKRRSPRKVMTTNGTGKSTTNDQSQADQGRERARSVSSTSSLSSVDEAIVEEGSPSTVALKNLIGNSPRTSNRPNGPFRDLNRTMATFFGGQHNKKRSHDAMAGPMDAEAEQLLRKKFMRAFPDYHVDSSEIRSSVQRAKEAEERAPAPVEPSRTTRQSLAGPLLPPRTAHALQYPFAGRSREASPREGNKLKTAAARVKTSPVKKRNVGGTGSGRNTGGQGSPIGLEESEELMSDNEEACKACNGGGLLVVCDNCDNAYHFLCADPPLEESSQRLDKPWYCNPCASRDENPRRYERTIFQPLLQAADNTCPQLFELPRWLENHFEGVRRGPGGDYDDSVPAEKIKTRSGWDDQSGHLKLKDSKDASILCIQCGLSSVTGRAIIQCDECKTYWHLDCVSPPMANPPPLRADGKSRNRFVCPRHVSHDLRLANNDFGLAQKRRLLGERFHRLRQPKQPEVIDTNLRPSQLPGTVLFEIDDESEPSDEFSDEEDEEEGKNVVYRVASRNVKLDFLGKVRTDSARLRDLRCDGRASKRSKLEPRGHDHAARVADTLSKRSFLDQRTALDLVNFADRETDLGLASDTIGSLILRLISEAPDAVVQQMDGETKSTTYSATTASAGQGPPSPPISERAELSEDQAQLYEKLQELIARRLQSRHVKSQ